MPNALLLMVIVLLTLLCLGFSAAFCIVANLRRTKQVIGLPMPFSYWFYGFAYIGLLSTTAKFYLQYFRGSYWHSALGDICEVVGLIAYVIAFLVIRKPWKAFIAANGGSTWALLETAQSFAWQIILRRFRP